MLAWYLTRPSVDVIIPGAKRADQVKSSIRAAEISLTQEEITAIDNIFS
ncbi:oxidoreductase ion channel [Geomicrobium sp. JCM 19039]|nr:oxidoreductase ion channel [Geomicrobium sp. JCM 19039]